MRKVLQKWTAGVCCLTLLLGMAACTSKQDEPAGVDCEPPKVTAPAEPTKVPEATKAPEVTETPDPTEVPDPTKAPEATKAPEVTEVPVVRPEGTLKDAAAACGFSFGTVVNAYSSRDLNYTMMVMDEFNSVTAANEMKAYSMLNQSVSMANPDGMPAIDFSGGDAIVSQAELLGIGVRGHVLVWDAYMVDWFFREGYTSNGPYVDQATMKKRLQYYIESVITHFETEFPGVVYCWDVVNEAVGDSEEDYDASDARHIRTLRGGTENQFYNIIGKDYVELSFLYAKDVVEKLQKQNPEVSIALFYNDYNAYFEEKCDSICEVVKSINSYAKDSKGNYRKLCDGVGMQSYIGGYGEQEGCMELSHIDMIRDSILKYSALDVEVHVTEMAVRNYDESLMDQHAEFCGKLFDMYVELNKEKPVVTNISIWGITDAPNMSEWDGNYRQNSPYCGLFDEKCKKKDAYYKVLEAMQKGTE
ncbi:MAG: endo-1,4-beta-xylanase [Lachnospiraceae bacterium]|nr:endo-1,4-beta-xylanase [Lachnospiraceae bacterium]